MKKLAIAAVALAAMTSAAAAQRLGGPDRIDQRQYNQERRIQQGVRSGEITRQEYRALEAEQARIRALEAKARRDGHIDRREARRIEAAQDAASRHIAAEKHDLDRSRNRQARPGLWKRRWW